MASKKIGLALNQMGRYGYGAGSHMYHAADGVADGGHVNGTQTHKIRKALHKMRLRASGMTDDINGAKETQGSMQNPYEPTPEKKGK